MPITLAVPPDGQMLFSIATSTLTLAIVAGALIGFLLLYQLFARGPRWRRGLRRAERLLRAGNWQQAHRITQDIGSRGGSWTKRVRRLQADCLQAGAEEAIQAQRYGDAVPLAEEAAALCGMDRIQARIQVIDVALAEARRSFAAAASPEQIAVTQAMLAAVLRLQSPCAEASFWQALCFIREGKLADAATALRAAHDEVRGQFLDPMLYLGGVALREGKAQEAVRWLAEANRFDPTCPFVTLQLGQAIVAAKGDSNLAVLALQRALTRLVPLRGDAVLQRAWAEFLPEGKSFVRRLATSLPFLCPILGGNLTIIIRGGQLALAEAEYRRGHYQAAADLFEKLLQECPPSQMLLRGLGLSLARLERYDEAFKHLRIAYEQEEPKQALTAGFLALCGALGKPKQAEDRPRNIAWAIRLLSRFELAGDTELARIGSRLLAEARSLGLPVLAEEQAHLCRALVSVNGTEPQDAAAYNALASPSSDGFPRECAWLYCRAAQQHGLAGQCDLDLFVRAFGDMPAMEAFYAARQWSLEDVEFIYLQRWAQQRPGTFPAIGGAADYPRRASDMLLGRSRAEAAAGKPDSARATAQVLLRLDPANVQAHDWLAQLWYQAGDLDRAADLLAALHNLNPTNPTPLVRRAVIEQKRGRHAESLACIERALERASEKDRGAIALLGARLALGSAAERSLPQASLVQARTWLEERLRHEPDDVFTLSLLAAVHLCCDDRPALAALAPAMDRPGVDELHFQYFASLCFLAAGDAERCLAALVRLRHDPAFAPEAEYVAAWAHQARGDRSGVMAALQAAGSAECSSSADRANAWLGSIQFEDGNYAPAAEHWRRVSIDDRRGAGVEHPLRAALLLAGLSEYRSHRYEDAAGFFRTGRELDREDERLRALLSTSLEQAARQLLFSAQRESPSRLPGCNGAVGRGSDVSQAHPVAS